MYKPLAVSATKSCASNCFPGHQDCAVWQDIYFALRTLRYLYALYISPIYCNVRSFYGWLRWGKIFKHSNESTIIIIHVPLCWWPKMISRHTFIQRSFHLMGKLKLVCHAWILVMKLYCKHSICVFDIIQEDQAATSMFITLQIT